MLNFLAANPIKNVKEEDYFLGIVIVVQILFSAKFQRIAMGGESQAASQSVSLCTIIDLNFIYVLHRNYLGSIQYCALHYFLLF